MENAITTILVFLLIACCVCGMITIMNWIDSHLANWIKRLLSTVFARSDKVIFIERRE